MAKRKIEKRICSGCIGAFDAKEMTIVSIGEKYQTIFCEKCVKNKNFPKREDENYIVKPLVKPRKPRAKKVKEPTKDKK